MKIEIKIDKTIRIITPPADWNELTPDQVLTILAVVQGRGTITQKRLSILRYLLPLTDDEIQEWEAARIEEYGEDWYVVHHSEILEMLPATDFLFEKDKSGQYHLRPALTKCPMKKLEGMPAKRKKGKKKVFEMQEWYAPHDHLENITAKELAYTFDRYEQYAKTKNEDHLHHLLAILYRPAKPPTEENLAENYHGDIRKPLNMATVSDRAAVIANLRPEIKNLIFFWFMSCRVQYINQYQNIFKNTPIIGERQGNDYGWWGTFRAIAGNLKDINQIADLDAGSVLAELSYLEDQRLLAEMNN